MDDSSWKVKCSSATLQRPLMATPSSTTPQEARNQLEVNSGQYFYPHAGHDLRSQGRGRMPDSMVSNNPNLSSYSGNCDLGNSFLALLSGPASFSPCDFHELPNPKQFSASSRVPSEDTGSLFNAFGSRAPLMSSRIPSENSSNQNQRNGANPVVSSKCASTSNSVLQHCLQGANFAMHSSDLAKAVIHYKVSDNEKVKDFSSLRGEWRSTNPANAVKLPDTNCQMPGKLALEPELSVSKNSSALSNQYPRVFCLGKSGELLLSSTGLLGILCSCHCFHMSVSKFCEHSGLWNVNPGVAVHMENGETVAQWRKLYFQKFGIRVPEDQSGWDWPEGLPLTASLVQSSVPLPLSKHSDCNHLVGSSEGLVRSGQPIDSVVFPKNPLTDHNLNQNPVFDVLDKQKRNGQGDNNFLGLAGTLLSNLHGVGNNTLHGVTDSTISRCTIMPTFVGKGPENGSQSISAYIDNIVKSGSFSTTNSALQNARTLFRCSDVSRAKDEKHCVIIDKDAASSSIELRLGQPNEQNWSSGNPVLSAVGPPSCNSLVNSHKPSTREQMIHYVTSCGGDGESRQGLPHVAGLLNSAREQDQLNYGRSAIKNTINVGKIENFKGQLAKSTVFLPFKHFNSPLEGNSYSRSTSNVVNSTEHIVHETLHSESHAVKYPGNVPLNGGNGLERQRTDPEFGFSRPRDKGKGVGCLTGNSFDESNLVSKMHNWKKNPSSFSEVINGNICAAFPMMHEKNHFPNHLSSIPLEASDAGSLSNYLDKVPSFGTVDRVFPGSLGSSMGSGQSFPSQAVPLGSGLTPAMLKQDGISASPYLLDDNLRLLAFRQILELSKQQHEMSPHGKNPEQDRCVKLQHSLFEPAASGLNRHETTFISKQNVSEVSMKSTQSTPTVKMGDDVAKFAHVTGLSNWCNFSTLTQGRPFYSQENDKHCQLSHGHLQNEQPSLRLGRNEHNITDSNEPESCCQIKQYFQTYCRCAAHTKCLGGKCGGGNHPNSFREPMRGVGGKIPALMASQIAKDNIIPRENTISLDHCGKLKGQAPKNISCTSQWKDVPSKKNNVCQGARVDQSAGNLDRRQHESGHLGDTAAKCSSGAVHVVDSFREQEISNISSGCSTPAVTQASNEVNKVDSSMAVTGIASCMKHLIVDEGSGIDKCWSSDDAVESDRSAGFCGSTCKTRLWKDGSSKVINNQSSRSLLDEVKLMDSLTWKRGRNQIQAEVTVLEKTNHPPEPERGFKTAKRKRETKPEMLDASRGTAGHAVQDKYPECDETANQRCLSKDAHIVSSGLEMPYTSRVSSIKPNSNGKSITSLSKPLSRKRDLQELYNGRDGEDEDGEELNDNASSCKIIEVSGRKKFRKSRTSDGCAQSQTLEPTCAVGEKTMRCAPVSHLKVSLSQQSSVCYRKPRPVVCGKYGEISNGEMVGDLPKPAKIVSLDTILGTAKKCTPPKNKKPTITSVRELKKTGFGSTNACRSSHMKKESEGNDASGFDEMIFCNSVKERETASVGQDKHFADELLVLKEGNSKTEGGCGILGSSAHTQSKPKFKEIRRRSLNELTLKGMSSCSVKISHKNILKCGQNMKDGKIIKSSEDSNCRTHESGEVNAKRNILEREHLSATDSDSFCCVCGSSNKDEVNCLLECGQCLIKVHQACYGISRVPKGHWYCRPCRTGAKNTVCVLCGYGGGALTQALRSHAIAKSLLKAWSFETESRPKNSDSSAVTLQDEFSKLHASGFVHGNNSYPVLRPENIESSTPSVWSIDMQKQLNNLRNSLSCVGNLKVHNSITAGVLDSTVKQWVHMVCGLWTPGTRCPNVDTMSAFDVSGASHPRANTVCSVCNRPGGSCIQCRVANCSVQFHPWCAHQKGLLQSEVEGVDNENVGFYGRCALHARYAADECACDASNNKTGCVGEKEESCARTEGYKGRKRDGFWHNLHGQSRGKGGCLVPQEQLNAWMHINGQKSCTGLSKLPMSDVEHDCRKEYARYKQAKGWKYLIVYKSGIHALGLYTSRFIYRGAMVVEYVGEIVGQRVADKREYEYGRKLQYKSACYFFRIDKEHIIDATRKGGIARFVNHSCLPNCVAKVISVRNEKKVVFFAERDIYPGEEITYDYHFNNEDEASVPLSHGASVPFPSFLALPPAVAGRADVAKYETEFSWGTRRPVVEAPIGEPVDNSPVLVLAPKRTYRKDPLNDFKRYTGGWNISDRHYWASVGFTAAPLFAIAAVWFLVFGLCLLFGCLCHFCCKRQRYGYSQTAYALSLVFLILFSICAMIGCVVLYTAQERFHKSTTETLEYVVNQADTTVDKLRAVSDFIASAKLVGVDEVFLPSNVQTDIDQIGTRINSSASVLADKTVDNSEDIKDLLDSVRVALITTAAIMLLLTFLGFLFSIFGMQFLVYILVIVGWILVAGTFILCGTFLLLHNVAGDTCVAMDHWVHNPTAHTALDDILPCVDQATTQDTLIKSKEITSQLVEVVNQVITNVSNLNFSPNFKPMYINQSGPLVPILCNPFYADLTIRPCSAGEVDLTNATQVWSSYVCQVSPTGICATTGRLTPAFYSQMSAAINVSYGLNNYAPFLIELGDCTFARETFSDIYKDHCPSLRRYSRWIYIGLVMVSTAVMLSQIFWVIYGRERRHRVYSKQLVSESAQGSEREKSS